MPVMMTGQPTPENWTAIAAFVLSAANLIGLGALFVWVADTFKRKNPKP